MGKKINTIILYVILVGISVICLLPFLLMIVNSTRSGIAIMTSFTLVPGDALQANWKTVNGYFNLFMGFFNSVKVAVPATVLTAYFSAMTAYAMAIYTFRGNKLFFWVIIGFMMIPSQLSLLGFYNLISRLHLINSYIPLIVPAIASPAIVFFLRQYVKSVFSPAIMEAARIDGASEIKIFHRIALPIMAPGIATMSIGAFVGNWNSYLVPLILLNTPKKFTLPVMIASLNSSRDIASNQGAIYLAVAISVVPILIVFAFCSKYIVSSISAGGVKE